MQFFEFYSESEWFLVNIEPYINSKPFKMSHSECPEITSIWKKEKPKFVINASPSPHADRLQ